MASPVPAAAEEAGSEEVHHAAEVLPADAVPLEAAASVVEAEGSREAAEVEGEDSGGADGRQVLWCHTVLLRRFGNGDLLESFFVQILAQLREYAIVFLELDSQLSSHVFLQMVRLSNCHASATSVLHLEDRQQFSTVAGKWRSCTAPMTLVKHKQTLVTEPLLGLLDHRFPASSPNYYPYPFCVLPA